MVERHWGTIVRLANPLLLHARLNRKFFYYGVKYAHYIHDVIPVKDLNDQKEFPFTPFFLATIIENHLLNTLEVLGVP